MKEIAERANLNTTAEYLRPRIKKIYRILRQQIEIDVDISRFQIALSILEDRSIEETSELLHISLGRTYQLRRKALGKLRKAVQGGEHDDSN